MKQRRLKLLGLILVGSLFLYGQLNWSAEAFGKTGDSKKNPRVIIILIDMSGSTNKARRTVYKEAFDKIYKNMDQGDRILVGTITSHSYIDFKPTVDEEIPKKSIWVNRLQFERNLTKTKKKIQKEVNRLLSRKRGSQWTEILNSLNIADTIFHDERKRQKILVILSDMIQDSKEYKFDKERITNQYINRVIKYRQKHKLIPNLKGVKVYVAGASAANSNKFRAVQEFWARYFVKSGADYSPHRYGHSLIKFE